ncbi:VOC family protein [Planosporangium flavigriseum]|uniref:Glyoxalase n=1 Tax=Planosporangium flavigriseum TaxID=373681 RepID=A0A8J3PKR7_9ACTN|nr:VOC family protein [Planosporangium flavigriseum]NJC63152.1 VOC family protein [Planosporangium flavigriseum]GIG72424.1 glyoxalase [Planosporangium flavigriseum]
MTRTMAPSFDGVHHFALTVRDLDKSVEWYKKVFQGDLVEGRVPHYGREWTGYAELVVEPRTGLVIGLHYNNANKGEEMDETRTGLDHISLKVDGRQGLEAWVDWLDSLGIAHSGIQSRKEPFAFSTIVFRDIDNNQLELIAVEV